MCRLICFREQSKIGSKSGEMFQYCDINQHVSCHVETVVLLSQRKPDDIVQVELNAEDLALTSAETKATYVKIKTYVKRAFGFKVSSLYIAQVKQKMGLPMGKNYNVSKKGTRVPLCPPEK